MDGRAKTSSSRLKLNEIYNELSISSKGIKLLKNLINDKEIFSFMLDSNFELKKIWNLLAILANSEDVENHRIVLDYLSLDKETKNENKFISKIFMYEGYERSVNHSFVSLFNTKSFEIHNYLLENVDLNKYVENEAIAVDIVKAVPEFYLKNERFRKQIFDICNRRVKSCNEYFTDLAVEFLEENKPDLY